MDVIIRGWAFDGNLVGDIPGVIIAVRAICDCAAFVVDCGDWGVMSFAANDPRIIRKSALTANG